MPTYDYVCRDCGHEFEFFQSMTDAVKRKCPACGKLKLERLIGAGAGIIFKGGGFYETDYRSESYKKAAEAEKKAANGDSGGSSDASADGGTKTDKAKSDTTTAGTGKAASNGSETGSKDKQGA